jgi:hypothetical protein
MPSLVAGSQKVARAVSVSQVLRTQHASTTAIPDDYAGRFADDGGPSPTEPNDDLRLLWAAFKDQRIRGVWWPRGRNITVELAALLPAADSYLGAPLIRVSSNTQAWDHHPRRLYAGSRLIRVGWFNSIDPATVEIGATSTERITLCVVPPEWTSQAGRRLFRALRDTKIWPTETDRLLQFAVQPETAGSA